MSHLLYNAFITLIISLFPYIASTTEDINNYYSNKTLDEIMLVIRNVFNVGSSVLHKRYSYLLQNSFSINGIH